MPAYLGGKRRLAPLIFAELAKVVPSETWSNLTLIDPFCGGGATSLQAKARGFRVVSADIIYLDPPYKGTMRYEREYQMPDEMLGDSLPDGDPPGLDELLDAACSVPVLILSYGGPHSNITELTLLVGRHWCVRRALSIPYRHLASIASKEKNAHNKEHLIIASR